MDTGAIDFYNWLCVQGLTVIVIYGLKSAVTFVEYETKVIGEMTTFEKTTADKKAATAAISH